MTEIMNGVEFAWRWGGAVFFIGFCMSYVAWIVTEEDDVKEHPAIKLGTVFVLLLVFWTAYWSWQGLKLT